MAVLFAEDFDGQAAGTALTSSNSTVSGVAGGTGVTTTFETGGIAGTTRIQHAVTTTSAGSNYFFTLPAARADGSYRAYYQITSNPAAVNNIFQGRDQVGAANRWQIRLTTTGTLEIRNANTTTVATTTTVVTGGGLFRVEVRVSGTTVALDVFTGANAHGTTATETVSGTFTSANFDRVSVGIITNTTSWTVYSDSVKGVDTTTGVGPADLPLVPWYRVPSRAAMFRAATR